MLAFLVAAFAAVVAGGMVMLFTVVAMWGLNRALDDRLGDTLYGDFDFEDFQQPDLMKFLQRAALAFIAPTFLALVTIYLLKAYFIISRANNGVAWLTFLVHYGVVFWLVHALFGTELKKTAIIAAISTLLYMFIYGVLIPRNMLF